MIIIKDNKDIKLFREGKMYKKNNKILRRGDLGSMDH